MKMVRKQKRFLKNRVLYEYKTVEYNKEEILNKFDYDVKTIPVAEKEALENPINMNELNDCLRGGTRNNVSPGLSGFSGTFYKIFRGLLRCMILPAIHQIFEDKHFQSPKGWVISV